MKNVIAIDIKENILLDSRGRTVVINDAEEVLDFLTSEYQPDTFVVVWNLFALVDVISRIIPEDKYAELLKFDKVWINGYKIFSVEGKKLSIGHEYRTLLHDNFYDYQKVEVDIYNLYKYQVDPTYQPSGVSDIVAKGIELLQTLEVMGMGETDTLSSGIAIYSNTILDNIEIPHLYDCPDAAIEMANYALEIMNREWRTVYQIGCWQPATDIDIRSAYPSLASKFGDLSTAKYWHSKKFEPCDFGLFKGYVTITGDISPIVDKDKQNKIGRYPDVITTEQWGFLNHYKIGKFEPIDGWMLKYQNDSKPFETIMADLYKQRESGGQIALIAKSIAVGLVGQLSQYYDNKKGKHYNPIYSVMATSRCSLKVARFIYDNVLEKNLISVNVDGCLVDCPVDVSDNNRMGDFRVESANALVLSLGHSYVGSKHPQNHDFEDMMLAIKHDLKSSAYNEVQLLENMNTTNRVWESYPTTGEDLISTIYRSKPIEVKEN